VQILSTAFASEGNCQKSACQKSRRALFLLASSLIFEMSIPGGSAKRQWYFFLVQVPIAQYFFIEKIFFALRKILG
jgi:hypothetical protein